MQHVDFLVCPFTTKSVGIANEHENNAQLFKHVIKSGSNPSHTERKHLPRRRFGIWMQLHCQISKPAECLSRRREYLPNLNVDECKTRLLCGLHWQLLLFSICMRCKFKTNAPFSPHQANKQFLLPFAAAGVRQTDREPQPPISRANENRTNCRKLRSRSVALGAITLNIPLLPNSWPT